MSENPFSEQLAAVVIMHRKKSGLTQKALAEYAGVGKTVVFDLEHGKETIQLDTLLKVLNVLNINLKIESPLMHEGLAGEMS